MNSKMFESDMRIAAMHVKRKQLHLLLPNYVQQKKKKHSLEGSKANCEDENSMEASLDSDHSLLVPSSPLQNANSPQSPITAASTVNVISVPNSETQVESETTLSKGNSISRSEGSAASSSDHIPQASPVPASTAQPKSAVNQVSSTCIGSQPASSTTKASNPVPSGGKRPTSPAITESANTEEPATNGVPMDQNLSQSSKRTSTQLTEGSPKRKKLDGSASVNEQGDCSASPITEKKSDENMKVAECEEKMLPIQSKASVSQEPMSTELSDVSSLPVNPVPVVKNSIKLRLNR